MNDKVRRLYEAIVAGAEEPVVYGIPDSNKYPLDTPQRVVFAIRIFNTIREEFHQQFAEAIVKQAQKFGIDLSLVPDTSALFKYLPRADKAESREKDQHIQVANPEQPEQQVAVNASNDRLNELDNSTVRSAVHKRMANAIKGSDGDFAKNFSKYVNAKMKAEKLGYNTTAEEVLEESSGAESERYVWRGK